MKEHPILFSSLMVQAILEGKKTQTRRIINPQPIDSREIDGNFFDGKHRGYVKVDGHPLWREQFAFEFAKWQPGDLLWSRESWQWEGSTKWSDVMPIGSFWYKADNHGSSGPAKWKPSIHMPKAAARIWLQVESVGVERLQDISEVDAIAEGIEFQEWEWGPIAFPNLSYPGDETATIDNSMVGVKTKSFRDYLRKDHWLLGDGKGSYKSLWQSINVPESWEQNPWVWVITFSRIASALGSSI